MTWVVWWWLDLWAHWLSVLEVAAPPPRGPPPDGAKIIDLAHWRRTHRHPGGHAA